MYRKPLVFYAKKAICKFKNATLHFLIFKKIFSFVLRESRVKNFIDLFEFFDRKRPHGKWNLSMRLFSFFMKTQQQLAKNSFACFP